MGMAFSLSAATNDIADLDFVGTWKIDAPTFTVRSLATPNSFPRPQLPTNHSSFTLTLKEDSSFVVTNFLPELFLDDPIRPPTTGKWYVRTQWVANPTRLNTNASIALGLTWRNPKNAQNVWVLRVVNFEKSTRQQGKLSAAIEGIRDQTQTYEWSFLITKEESINRQTTPRTNKAGIKLK